MGVSRSPAENWLSALSYALTAGVLALTRPMSPGALRRVGVSAGGVLRRLLHRRLRTTLRLALGAACPAQATDRYFDRVGVCAGWSLAIFHHGIERAGIDTLVRLDESVELLDAAVAEGRGVVIAVPHWFCYDLAGAVINRRHRGCLLIRESSHRRHQRMKDRWYDALGVETIRRPRRVSAFTDTRALLERLRRGAILGLTPDLVVAPDEGVPVEMFGRTVHLRRGAVALSRHARAPLLSFTPRWDGDSVSLRWHREPDPWELAAGPTGIQHALQSWCAFIEAHVVRHPEDWLFWLDKRWTWAIRGAPGLHWPRR